MGICLCVGACACGAAVSYLIIRNCLLIKPTDNPSVECDIENEKSNCDACKKVTFS